MAFILPRSIGDQALQLGQEDFLRKMPFGNNWNKLRIGFRYQTPWTGGNVLIPRLFVGVSNGTDYGFLSPYTTDCVGAIVGTYASYLTPSLVLYRYNWYSGQILDAARKVGSVVTLTLGTNSNSFFWNGFPNYASGFAMEITRNTDGTYTTIVFYNESVGLLDISRNTFLVQMESSAAPTWCSNTSSAKTIAGGAFYDSLHISWNKSIPTLNLSDITVLRLY